jgi:hypothetical protein
MRYLYRPKHVVKRGFVERLDDLHRIELVQKRRVFGQNLLSHAVRSRVSILRIGKCTELNKGIGMNRKRATVVCSIILMLGFAIHSAERAVKPTQAAMRLKLTYAQGVLEGITLEKFDLIITNAAKLRDMSQTNAFVLLVNRDYQNCRTNFQASVDALTRAAKEQNSQKATEAYMKMAQCCFDCHKTFRREQFVRGQLSNSRFENPNPPEPNQP